MRHLDHPQGKRSWTARTPRALAGGLGAAVLICGAVVAPAQARPIESGSFSDSFTETIDCGNRSLGLEATIVGTFVVKDSTPRTGGQFFKFSQTAEFNGTFTDPDPLTAHQMEIIWTDCTDQGGGFSIQYIESCDHTRTPGEPIPAAHPIEDRELDALIERSAVDALVGRRDGRRRERYVVRIGPTRFELTERGHHGQSLTAVDQQ